jgi:hypothetical protein
VWFSGGKPIHCHHFEAADRVYEVGLPTVVETSSFFVAVFIPSRG